MSVHVCVTYICVTLVCRCEGVCVCGVMCRCWVRECQHLQWIVAGPIVATLAVCPCYLHLYVMSVYLAVRCSLELALTTLSCCAECLCTDGAWRVFVHVCRSIWYSCVTSCVCWWPNYGQSTHRTPSRPSQSVSASSLPSYSWYSELFLLFTVTRHIQLLTVVTIINGKYTSFFH